MLRQGCRSGWALFKPNQVHIAGNEDAQEKRLDQEAKEPDKENEPKNALQ